MTRMSRQDFRRWAEEQDFGRYELVAGEPVAMAPEGVAHARLKARIWRAVDREIGQRGLPCEALPDGITIEIEEITPSERDLARLFSFSPSPARGQPFALCVVNGMCGQLTGENASEFSL